MVRRFSTSVVLWFGIAIALAVCLALVGTESESSAHEGHDEDLWEFTWNRGATERLLRYKFWHYNTYRKETCDRYEWLHRDCAYWVDTGITRTRSEDSCAARPVWVVAELDANRNQKEPDPPNRSTCNRHGTYYEGISRWIFTNHETKRVEIDRTTGPLRCRLPITGIQSASTSTDTSPPGGKWTVYKASRTFPSRGTPARCGYWSSARPHPARTAPTTTTAPERNGAWTGSCSFSLELGRSYSERLPTYSGDRVSGYSYSGNLPDGMAVRGSPPKLIGAPTEIGTFSGSLRARLPEGEDTTLSCTFRVSTRPRPTTTTTPRPTREPGWLSPCYITMQLGESYGTRLEPEEPLPWYRGADQVRYSGRRPPGVSHTRIDGEAYLFGIPSKEGSFKGRVTAWKGRKRLSTQDCLIVVRGGTWNPSACQFFLEAGKSYNLTMPRYSGIRVDRYYTSGGLPPGLSSSGTRVIGSPGTGGTWSVSWTAVIDNVSTRPRITCTFNVESRDLSSWSGACDWTFTVGYSYTRLLPVAEGASIHRWVGEVPDGMRMRFVLSGGIRAQQLSGQPTTEGVWGGTVVPTNPRPDGVDNLECSFEVIPGPNPTQCSLTLPASELLRIRDEIEWHSDLPRTGGNPDLPGGHAYIFTTGDPGVAGGSPRIWPWWSSDDALTVTDTTDCQWSMTRVVSAARPVFPWFGDGLDTIRRAAPAMYTQWKAMTTTQRKEAEATARRILRRVGLGTPEDRKWVGKACRPGDIPERYCAWGLPFPGVWEWSLTVRYRSDNDSEERDLILASGATRFWRFADQVGG